MSSSLIIRRALLTRLPVAARPLSTSAVLHKSVTESVKETVQGIDKKVGQTLAAGIDKAEQATEAVKQTVGAAKENSPTANQATESVKETVNSARQNTPTAEEAKGMAKGKSQEVKGQVKGKANEISGKAKGAFNEATAGSP
ncbi:hypothetical protein DRE_07381 [Drechslerella stenobrocha 248]|uniref:LEA domain protein n=1 Tax=Drechslerella stenobrocha 248 TaxID=1043628 RepID=W7HV60_9PEZI|nr:hypothetical protein DRE_07381 [Drechslerella stenobrocha 248]